MSSCEDETLTKDKDLTDVSACSTYSISNGKNELLNAILQAMKHPHLNEILTAVTDIFTESTTFIRNSYVMHHQESFALEPNTNGMMDVLRKAFLANVYDVCQLADEYAEEFGITVSKNFPVVEGIIYHYPPIDSWEVKMVRNLLNLHYHQYSYNR